MIDHVYASEHAVQNLFKRYGIITTTADWRQAFLDIMDGRSLLLGRVAQGRERYLIQIHEITVIVIYDPAFAKFITVLPKDYKASISKR